MAPVPSPRKDVRRWRVGEPRLSAACEPRARRSPRRSLDGLSVVGKVDEPDETIGETLWSSEA